MKDSEIGGDGRLDPRARVVTSAVTLIFHQPPAKGSQSILEKHFSKSPAPLRLA
jgi:hypothetical protein